MNTYQHGLNRRSINEVFETILKSAPRLVSFLGRGADAINTKHEWINDVQDAKALALASNYTSGSGTMVFTTAPVHGTIVEFEVTATGKPVGGQYRVTGGTTTATVVLVGGTDANITAATSTAIVVSEAKKEGSAFIIDASNLPSPNWNFTQIFSKVASVTGTQQTVRTHGIEDALAYQEQYQLGLIARELDRQLLRGFRFAGSEGDQTRMMGGLAEFVYKMNGANADLDLEMFNDAVQTAYSRGALNPNVIVAHPMQSAKFAAMKINTTTMRQDPTGGSSVSQVEGNLGGIHSIIWDFNQKKDRIDIIDTSMAEINYLREFISEDIAKTGDTYDRSIVGELTVSIRNGQNCHIAIDNLAL